MTLHLALIRVVREREKRESRKGGAKSVWSYVRQSNTLLQGLLNSDDKVVQCLLDHLTYLLTYLLRHDYKKHKGALEREVTAPCIDIKRRCECREKEEQRVFSRTSVRAIHFFRGCLTMLIKLYSDIWSI